MKKDLVKLTPITSSFLSCEKDVETILRKLFIESYPYSDLLKRLLIINTNDCLDTENKKYQQAIDNMSLKQMRNAGYIKLEPKVRLPEHEQVKAYMIMTFDNFIPNPTNPKFRDCIVSFDIICHTDYWDIGDYRLRPLKIVGYIDGLLNNCKLSGIGTFQFAGCNELILSEDLSGYTLTYKAIHGSDDQIPRKE